ncbi:unnamed protein product [Cyprideis torosa]|uniref:Uncharacterized protein n=1 Tax=Cyprideis torosa TaxID=163714 RepID=A0A7R8WH95_9CRUS|nr:unnamed protein product [Cyprideis torosa]CAG0893549.1 unnamed protein product [Cyprideis torosa]
MLDWSILERVEKEGMRLFLRGPGGSDLTTTTITPTTLETTPMPFSQAFPKLSQVINVMLSMPLIVLFIIFVCCTFCLYNAYTSVFGSNRTSNARRCRECRIRRGRPQPSPLSLGGGAVARDDFRELERLFTTNPANNRLLPTDALEQIHRGLTLQELPTTNDLPPSYESAMRLVIKADEEGGKVAMSPETHQEISKEGQPLSITAGQTVSAPPIVVAAFPFIEEIDINAGPPLPPAQPDSAAPPPHRTLKFGPYLGLPSTEASSSSSPQLQSPVLLPASHQPPSINEHTISPNSIASSPLAHLNSPTSSPILSPNSPMGSSGSQPPANTVGSILSLRNRIGKQFSIFNSNKHVVECVTEAKDQPVLPNHSA